MPLSIKPNVTNNNQKRPLIYMVDSVGEQRGMHYYNFSLVSALNESGVDVILVSTSETATHPLKPDNIVVRSGFQGIYGDKPKWIRGIKYALSLLRIGWWITKDTPQIAHFHFYQIPILDLGFLFFLKLLGVRVISTIHDVLPFHLGTDFESSINSVYYQIYSNSSGIVLHSAYARNALAQVDKNLLDKAALIPHGDFSTIASGMRQKYALQKSDAKTKIGLEPSMPMILIFGTIKANKKLDVVIRAMVNVIKQFPSAKLMIVGKPQDRDVSQDIELSNQLGVASSVFWRLERISDEELVWHFAAADVLVFPYQWIYQSGALLMAMSLGKPVIASDVGSNTSVVNHNVTGVLVSLDTSEKMSNAINELLSDPSRAEKMGQAAQTYVATELSWDKIAQSTIAFYEQIYHSAK